jgi:hypothetical protein
VAYALVGLYAAASGFWTPLGTFGFSPEYDARIGEVAPEGPAARAGIVAGDRIALAATPFEERRYIAGVEAVVPIGTVVHLHLIRAGASRDVRLVAAPSPLTRADRLSLLLRCVAALLFIAVGGGLIWLRPSRATWGFGLYCLLDLPTPNDSFRFASAAAALATVFVYDVVQNVGVVGLLVFALEFPRPFPTAWRRRIERLLPWSFGLLVVMTLYPDVANLLLGRGAQLENRLLQIAFGTVFGLAIYILFDTYRRIVREQRERLRWVLVGFTLGLLVAYLGDTLIFSTLLPFDAPRWLANVMITLNVLLPLTVAHAVIRHRVLDINFVIGRALVYASLTTILATLFGLLDWGFGHFLEDFRLSRLVEAGISICIAFAFDMFHKRTEDAIETVFFRKRRAAEARLERLTRDLPQARVIEVVEKALIGEVLEALELTSAALYRLRGATFVRTASLGWDQADCPSLDDSDLLVLALRADKRAVELADLPWHRTDVPAGALAPVVALPLYSRADLAGIVFYGGHPGGGDIDPTELAFIERLAHAASIAFDELEAERLRVENTSQAAAMAELRARLDELRGLARATTASQRPLGTVPLQHP